MSLSPFTWPVGHLAAHQSLPPAERVAIWRRDLRTIARLTGGLVWLWRIEWWRARDNRMRSGHPRMRLVVGGCGKWLVRTARADAIATTYPIWSSLPTRTTPRLKHPKHSPVTQMPRRKSCRSWGGKRRSRKLDSNFGCWTQEEWPFVLFYYWPVVRARAVASKFSHSGLGGVSVLPWCCPLSSGRVIKSQRVSETTGWEKVVNCKSLGLSFSKSTCQVVGGWLYSHFRLWASARVTSRGSGCGSSCG